MCDSVETEKIALNKPYMTPFMNTFGSQKSKWKNLKTNNRDKNSTRSREPKKIATGTISLDLNKINEKPVHCKKNSKQLKKDIIKEQ
mmetsp:Transcript_17705/g.15621  ORF Transcript_17705/g.15621 Transcript_17705/m.15621 type:complete len:87 (+) Transcript_17705:480-740(+)